MSEPRVAWFTPLEPVESGISLYNQELLPLIAHALRVDVIVDGYSPTVLVESDRLRLRQYREYRRSDYDLVVYQVGNSPAHIYMLDEMTSKPGVLVLHDTMLNHLHNRLV